MASLYALSSRSSAFCASTVAPVRRVAVAPVRPVTTVEVEAKLKTRKSMAKRVRVTGTGKVMARSAGKQHFNEKMSRDEIRESSKMFVLSKGDAYQAKENMPHSKINAKAKGKK